MIPATRLAWGARWVAAAGAGLLLLAVAFQLTLYGALATSAASAAPGSARPSTGTAGSALLPLPVAAGDTRWGSGANTYCETFVEQELGLGNQGDTAFGAYLRLAGMGLVHAGPPPQAGDLVYFAPTGTNAFDGHVGIADGAGQFTSVTTTGVQALPLAGWDAPYLGWVRPSDIRTDRFGHPVSAR
jgi:cell wall-associated NlpC family hydrolase